MGLKIKNMSKQDQNSWIIYLKLSFIKNISYGSKSVFSSSYLIGFFSNLSFSTYPFYHLVLPSENLAPSFIISLLKERLVEDLSSTNYQAS